MDLLAVIDARREASNRVAPSADSSVSIALCTYNGSSYLSRQLASLCEQTLQPMELVVCDDRSTDGTVDILEAFARTAPFTVTIRRNETQLGYRRNFMQAARLCRGELIAFCDQDDIWLPDKLATCVSAMADPAVMLVVHDVMIADGDGQPTGHTLYRHHVFNQLSASRDGQLLQPWPHFLGLTQVFRKVLIDSDACDAITDHLSGERLAHDQIVPFAALERGRFHYIAEPLALYRQHGNNVAGVRNWTLRERITNRIQYLRQNRAAEYRYWANAARERSEFLRRPSRPSGLDGPFAAPEVAERYAELARLFEARMRLYAEAGLISRIRAFRVLIRMGAYTDEDNWHLPARTRFRDLLFGIFLHPLLRPLGEARR